MANLTWAEITELTDAATTIANVSYKIAQMAEARPRYVIEAENLRAVRCLLLVVLARVTKIVRDHDNNQ